MSTCHGTTFESHILHSGQCSRNIQASDTLPTPDSPVIHSTTPVFNPAPHRRTFLELIRALPNQSPWENFVADGDDSWIYDGL
jgi:hypothetical protein